jgi:hypothetical protein
MGLTVLLDTNAIARGGYLWQNGLYGKIYRDKGEEGMFEILGLLNS